MATATAAAGSGISWEDEKAYFGFHPAALVDDVANVLLDYLCTGLDHVDVALTELEDEDNVMHADMVQRSIDDTTAQYQASVQRSFDALEREGLTVMRMPLQSVLPAAPPVAWSYLSRSSRRRENLNGVQPPLHTTSYTAAVAAALLILLS